MPQKDRDLFFADQVYPDAHSIFSWRPKRLEEVKNECLVVLDTNVLLAPYTSVSQENLSVIADTYKSLIKRDRMIVPAQAAREFARLRPTKLAELHGQLFDLKSKDLKINLGSYPLLEDVGEYSRVRELAEQIANLAQDYKRAIGELAKAVEGWEWNDPVSQVYAELFGDEVVVDPEFDNDSIERDLDWRKQNGVPPGYKDSGKVGDLLIWHTILKIAATRNKDLIFVTGDVKADWWHQSNNKNLYPRHELAEEYRRESEGASFHMLTFPSFLSLYGVNEKVVEEVRNATPEHTGSNSVMISDGQLLVVRHNGMYGALLVLRQVVRPRDEFVAYRSWFLPDGSWKFDQPSTVEEYAGTARMYGSVDEAQLRIDPIRLDWSGASTGAGYVYFGPSSTPSPEYELAVLNEPDVTRADASRLQFFNPVRS